MEPDSPPKEVEVFILSDATGMTAELVISAVLVQFRGIRPVYKKYPYIQTREQVRTILERAGAVQGLVICSLVSAELRDFIREEQRQRPVILVDLLGPILERIQNNWQLMPLLQPGLLRGVNEESLRLAEAIDFTLRHDDGKNVDTAGTADLIIFGVSRTSKTPTSLYLSCNHGLKVANIPIVLNMYPPRELFSLPVPKVGFLIEAERLAFIRQTRLKYIASIEYSRVSHIREELEFSRRIFERIKGLEVIDVSQSSIEEVAGNIMESKFSGKRGESRRPGGRWLRDFLDNQ